MFRKAAVWIVMAFGLLMCQSALTADNATKAAEKVDKTQAVATTTPATPSSELSFPQNLMQILTNGGVVAAVVAAVAALASMVALPMFGVRYCQLFGNCDNVNQYSAYQNDMYAQYPQPTYPTGNTYQKRSTEYVVPVIHMLKAAYDKYGLNTLATPKNNS